MILKVKFSDGSYIIPVSVIASHRAKTLGDIDSFEKEFVDTLNLFEYQPGQIKIWATEQMTWDDVKGFAIKVDTPVDYNKEWKTSNKELIETQVAKN